ncbi:MAG: LPS assembly lipoprotein LptE [Methylococcales bacterium]|nr:LPS assembly lipoprotein LptE [Methylococcales bacterium]MDD5755428.1 LPS assembly lipoprotein LptE [Methylococcales bacterium]
MSTRLNALLFLSLTSTLTACGFHPHGAYSLPTELKNVYFEGGSPALRDQMQQQLRISHAQLVPLQNASMVIKLFGEQFQRRGVSLSERGKTNEYELIYRVEYELATPKDAVLLARQPLEIRRDYYNDQQAILARDNEETVLRSEMAQQVVKTLLNQARFTLEKSEK